MSCALRGVRQLGRAPWRALRHPSPRAGCTCGVGAGRRHWRLSLLGVGRVVGGVEENKRLGFPTYGDLSVEVQLGWFAYPVLCANCGREIWAYCTMSSRRPCGAAWGNSSRVTDLHHNSAHSRCSTARTCRDIHIVIPAMDNNIPPGADKNWALHASCRRIPFPRSGGRQ